MPGILEMVEYCDRCNIELDVGQIGLCDHCQRGDERNDEEDD